MTVVGKSKPQSPPVSCMTLVPGTEFVYSMLTRQHGKTLMDEVFTSGICRFSCHQSEELQANKLNQLTLRHISNHLSHGGLKIPSN